MNTLKKKNNNISIKKRIYDLLQLMDDVDKFHENHLMLNNPVDNHLMK
jgi:hypothetical protein